MRAVVITKHGGPEVLEIQERPEPAPGSGQVRIDVRAAGVNFADTLARVGLYPDAPEPPCVVGYEVAGKISAVGEGVDAGRVGERVMAGTAFGGYAEQVVVPVADVVALPDRLSFEEGAAVPVVYATAGRRCTATARYARASASSSTAPPAAWASPCCSWPSRRRGGPRSPTMVAVIGGGTKR